MTTDTVRSTDVRVGDWVETSVGTSEVTDVRVDGNVVDVEWESVTGTRSGVTTWTVNDVVDVDRS